ncbi:hypothetical protein FQN50_005461 [Emmonsiellopsis sp. PD_5]|nr:hypothetical protein FQN50_005461 [Emmonsiellopsis sp. PD_5]
MAGRRELKLLSLDGASRLINLFRSLIAILLGRLKLDVRQCIDVYRSLSSRAFKRKRRLGIGPGGKIRERFDSKELEIAVKTVVAEHCDSEDELLSDPDTSSARATSAASSFFDPITIGPNSQCFVDGATGANNPVRQLWREANDVWSTGSFEDKIGCIVSIGTGVPPVKKFGNDGLDIFHTLKRLATETEATARGFLQEHSELDDSNRYFRFNVPDGLSEIGLDEVAESAAIVEATHYYLANETIQKQIKTCARVLGQKECITAFKTLPSDDFLALSERPEWKLTPNGDFSYNIFDSLSTYEPEQAIQEYLLKKCPATTEWIVQSRKFKRWVERKSHPCLWLSGEIGSGKSFTASTVVEHMRTLTRKTPGFVAHFFYRHSNSCQPKADDLVRSYIKQIIGFLGNECPEETRNYVKRFYGPKHYRPNFEEITSKIFIPLTKRLPDIIYAVDGLDECEPMEVQKVLKVFRQVIALKGPSVFISGRDSLDVKHSIPGSILIHIADGDNKEDINNFINWKIEEKMLERQLTEDESVLQEIKNELNKGADRMILWVNLQLEVLWEECLTVDDIRGALRNLPKDLDETYIRCLTRIGRAQIRFAPRILRWMLVATRPFTIDQLGEALAVDPTTGHLDRDKIPPPQNVLKCCANLITQNTKDQVLFIHHSVRQFLTERRPSCLVLPDELGPNAAELDLGEICVAHLTSSDYSLALQPSNQIQVPSLNFNETFMTPLAKNIPPLARLFLPNSKLPNSKQIRPTLPHTAKTRNITQFPAFFTFAREQWAPLTRNITMDCRYWKKFRMLALEPNSSYRFHPWQPGGPSLDSHYFGLLGWCVANTHLPLLRLLLDSDIQRPRSDIFNLPLHEYGNLPVLHLASRNGNTEVVRRLLQKCNVAKRDNNYRTALHHAAEAGFPEVAALLVDSGASMVMVKDNNGDSPLDIAMRHKHETTVITLRKLARGELTTKVGEGWRGSIDNYGELLLFGSHDVIITGMMKREVHFQIYVFDYVVLFLKELPAIGKDNTKLRPAGRARMQDIIQLLPLQESGRYMCDIRWKNEIDEDFTICFSSMEQMCEWVRIIDDQRRIWGSIDSNVIYLKEPIDMESLSISNPYPKEFTDNVALAEESQELFKAKVHYPSAGIITHLIVSTGISYQSLRDRIDNKLRLSSDASLDTGQATLNYLDEDNYVSILCDEDVQIAFEVWNEQHQQDSSLSSGGEVKTIDLYYVH